MAWSTFERFARVPLLLQLLTIQCIASQDKYNNRPHSEIYNKNRVNEFNGNLNNITNQQNINTRHFLSNDNYNPNINQGYNPYQYQYQQQPHFGYPGGAGGLNFQGVGYGYPGSVIPGYSPQAGIGYPSAALTGYPGGSGIGFPGAHLTGYPGGNGIDEKGLMFPLPIGHYPQQNLQFQTSATFKPPHFQPSNPSGAQGFGGFYPNLPQPQILNQLQFQHGHNNFYPGNHYRSPHDGFDIGTLPRQVRVPGNIQVILRGRDAEISCEFPRYLLLVQGIFWHHKYDPFGSYYDTQNGFGPRVTVQSEDQWKSILRIQEYTEDDFGIYRCISAAALPTDGKSNQLGFSTRNGELSTTTQPYPENSQEFDSGESQSRELSSQKAKKRKNSRKMKFPPTSKLRFTRQTGKKNSLDEEDQISSATDPSTYFPTSNQPLTYDPFVNNRNTEIPGHLRNTYPDYNQQNYINNYNRYPASIPNQTPFISNNIQSNRHFIPGFENHQGWVSPQFSQIPGYGLQVPFYKPSYSIYTVFQEVQFQPGGVRSSGALSSTSANPIKTQ